MEHFFFYIQTLYFPPIETNHTEDYAYGHQTNYRP